MDGYSKDRMDRLRWKRQVGRPISVEHAAEVYSGQVEGLQTGGWRKNR